MTYLEIYFWAATCPSFWSWRSPLGPQMKWVKLKLSWQHHISQVQKKIRSSIFAPIRTKIFIPLQARKNIYNSLISSHLKLGAMIYGANKNHKINKLHSLQKKAIRLVSLSKLNSHYNPLFLEYTVLNLPDLIKYDKVCFMHRLRYLYLPTSFTNLLQLKIISVKIGSGLM